MPYQIKDGHKHMVAILDSIWQNASPKDCFNLNHRKADMFKSMMLDLAGDQQKFMVGKFYYADQLLKAGENEAAAMHFLEIIQASNDRLDDNTKIVYEMLALTYMRMGEQANCINSHTAESCILPLQGGGIYKMTSGPENAIKIYERILKAYPDDVQSMWLLNLANMALGNWPDGVPQAFRFPASVFQNKGDIKFTDAAIPAGVDRRGISGGICTEDFDGDGLLDLFVTSYGINDQCRFYHNDGNGQFTDRTAQANLTGIVSGLNTIHADYDNDGDRDILILRGAWLIGGTHPNSLLRNNGDGTFTDVTIDAGLLSFHPTQAADWADYDGDGWLDLYIGNETRFADKPHPCELYHNNGNGTFTNVAAKLGVNFQGFFKAATWGDVNNDQRPDLYLSNLLGPNILLINRGGSAPEAWQFEDASQKAGVTKPENSFPGFFFDFNNDGFDDIFTSEYTPDPESPSSADLLEEYLGRQPKMECLRLYRNNGNETFTDVHASMGLHTVTFGMGNNFGDFDNDGWTDIYLGTGRPDLRSLIPNRMFHNLGGQKFEDISMNGIGHIQKGHGVAIADIDNDGDQDIYVTVGGAFEGDISNNVLFKNAGNSNHWITIELEGKTCNRDAIGAKIRVNTLENGQKRQIYTTVGTGGSFGSSSLRQEIGLGKAEKIESVEIFWPKAGLAPTVITNAGMDAAWRIREGDPAAQPVSWKKIDLK